MTHRSCRTLRLRTVLALAVVAVAAALARPLGRHRRRAAAAIAGVAPDLRTPVLWLPLDLTGDRMLRAARTGAARPTRMPTGVTVRTEHVGGDVPVLVYEPSGRARPGGALLWIHGGGLVMGSAAASHEVAGRFARDLGIVVVSVDYRLAPEHPFPAGLDDCSTALAWLHRNADALGVDPARIAVGGDSAGGGLAACLAQRARDEGGPPICFQLLVYPMLDDRTVGRAERADRDALLWTPRSNRYAWTAYLGRPPDAPKLPGHVAAARGDDLAGLPPAWIGVGELDLFLEEDVDYATRLEAAGVPCELHLVPGMYHAADRLRPGAPAMVDFTARATAALAAAVGD